MQFGGPALRVDAYEEHVTNEEGGEDGGEGALHPYGHQAALELDTSLSESGSPKQAAGVREQAGAGRGLPRQT
eukprot:scaffold147585_cov33-Tisochrysis_lutea.AAC.2